MRGAFELGMWSRALHHVERSTRPTRARYNKSLDASGISGLLIDNLSVTQLLPAASTQPLYRRRFLKTENQRADADGLVDEVIAIARDEVSKSV